ncbi:hypothetical protein Tco_0078629 [Tanacetum coccineum]
MEPQGIYLGYASSISPSKEKRQNGLTEYLSLKSRHGISSITVGNSINLLNSASTLSPKKRGGIELKRSHEADECKQNNWAEQVCLSGGDIYDDPSLLRFYQNDDTPSWGNNKRKEKGEDGPEWTIRSRFEDELTNFMLEKKSRTKGIGEMLDQHHEELHEQFSQILSTIRKSKTPKPEAPTFAITTRSGVSTQDLPFPAPSQSTFANHT